MSEKAKRRHFDKDFDISNLEQFMIEVDELKSAQIESVVDLQLFIKKVSELNRIVVEEINWRYLQKDRYLFNRHSSESLQAFYNEIILNLDKYNHEFNKKTYNSPFRVVLPDYLYNHLMKLIKTDIDLYCEENKQLFSQSKILAQDFYKCLSMLYIEYKGESIPLTEIYNNKYSDNSEDLEIIWNKSITAKYNSRGLFNDLLNRLIEMRNQIAKNASEQNYFDYTYKENSKIHFNKAEIKGLKKTIREHVIPKLKAVREDRVEFTNMNSLMNQDKYYLPLVSKKPYTSTDDFMQKSIKALSNISSEFGKELQRVYDSDFYDFEYREGKRAGEYCFRLPEHRGAFLFMNTLGSTEDVNLLFHNVGHLLHYIKSTNIQMTQYFEIPDIIGEVAALAMELFSLEELHVFYENELDVLKLKRQKMYKILVQATQIPIVDDFVEWLFTSSAPSVNDKDNKYRELFIEYDIGVDYSSCQHLIGSLWAGNPHIFTKPFFYIKYLICQIGAVAIYKSYLENKNQTIRKFTDFLALGYSKPINELYEAAGIKFDFSEKYLTEIYDFLFNEIKKINQRVQLLSKQE